MSFWILAAVIVGLVGVLVALAMGRRRSGDQPTAGYDVQIYRDQLKEIDRDVARGVIPPQEAERVRIEVSRRLLDADRNASDAAVFANQSSSWIAGGLIATLLILGSFFLYFQLGAPGYPDLPLNERIARSEMLRAERPIQIVAEETMGEAEINPNADPRLLELLVELRAALMERPDDLQGHILLARNEAGLGNFAAAHLAQARVIAIKGDGATAADYADLADMMILAAGGYVSPEAEIALTETLQRDPQNGTARYYYGLMYAQGGRPDVTFRVWKPLLADSGPDEVWVQPIRQQIEMIAADAGVRFSLPQAAPVLGGPDADAIQAASQMSQEERGEMIQGMVDQLSDRLATNGGPPEEWARLIGALGVLGETDRAASIWTEAKALFADTPDALAIVRDAAKSAGVAD